MSKASLPASFPTWAADNQREAPAPALSAPPLARATGGPPPFGHSGEVGKDVAGHHVETGLGELPVEALQAVVGLSHGVLVGRAQAGAGDGGLYPAREGGQREG